MDPNDQNHGCHFLDVPATQLVLPNLFRKSSGEGWRALGVQIRKGIVSYRVAKTHIRFPRRRAGGHPAQIEPEREVLREKGQARSVGPARLPGDRG
jgi:hypothetical protein